MLMPSIFGENLFDDFFEDFPWMDDNMDKNFIVPHIVYYEKN
jgi:hypothetical protein